MCWYHPHATQCVDEDVIVVCVRCVTCLLMMWIDVCVTADNYDDMCEVDDGHDCDGSVVRDIV